MAAATQSQKRIEITYFEGINSAVYDAISKKEECNYLENARSTMIGVIEKRGGIGQVGSNLTNETKSYGLFYFNDDIATSNKLYRATKNGVTTNINLYYLKNDNTWNTVAGVPNLASSLLSTTNADRITFCANGSDNNFYLKPDGTYVDSTTLTGHLYNSPKGYKITYFKDRLLLAYEEGSSTVKNKVIKSSAPLGIVCLANEDRTETTGSLTIKITGDIKYAVVGETLNIYRGGSTIGNVVVVSKTQTTLTVTITGTLTGPIMAADEFWVNGTKNGQKIFRWSDPNTGNDVERYDVFKIGGGDNSRINAMVPIGNTLWLATNKLFATFDGDYVKYFDYNIGCCAPQGSQLFNGILYFVSYKGLYATDGQTMPKNIGAKIQPYINSISKAIKETAVVTWGEESVFFSFSGTLTDKIVLYNNDGSIQKVLDNITFEWNVRQENWYIHTSDYLDIGIMINAPYLTSTDSIIYSRISDGKIYKLLATGTRTETIDGNSVTAKENVYTDIAQSIAFNITTSNIYLGAAEDFSYPKYIVAEVVAGNNIKCFASLEDGPFYEQDMVSKGMNFIKFKPFNGETDIPRTRKVRLSFREMSGQVVKIARCAVVYTLTNEVQPNEVTQVV